ncbi:hypothetical protein Sa4125_31650 [Aureimonas sp. SA4125]|nr:hypothetical protein Sa4125_31650 [Aureimonas sp. SA4125]
MLTFDSFSWASLLAKREALVIDRLRPRGMALTAALEEAGAVVTLAPGQSIAADRLGERKYSLIVLSLSVGEPVLDRMAPSLAAAGAPQVVVLVEPPRHAEIRAICPHARIGDHRMSDRELVMFIIGTPDE